VKCDKRYNSQDCPTDTLYYSIGVLVEILLLKIIKSQLSVKNNFDDTKYFSGKLDVVLIGKLTNTASSAVNQMDYFLEKFWR
jgi:hypothetical protein